LGELAIRTCSDDGWALLAALNLPPVIAASGTTVVDGIAPSLLANATQELAPAHGNVTLNFVSVDR